MRGVWTTRGKESGGFLELAAFTRKFKPHTQLWCNGGGMEIKTRLKEEREAAPLHGSKILRQELRECISKILSVYLKRQQNKRTTRYQMYVCGHYRRVKGVNAHTLRAWMHGGKGFSAAACLRLSQNLWPSGTLPLIVSVAMIIHPRPPCRGQHTPSNTLLPMCQSRPHRGDEVLQMWTGSGFRRLTGGWFNELNQPECVT